MLQGPQTPEALVTNTPGVIGAQEVYRYLKDFYHIFNIFHIKLIGIDQMIDFLILRKLEHF